MNQQAEEEVAACRPVEARLTKLETIDQGEAAAQQRAEKENNLFRT